MIPVPDWEKRVTLDIFCGLLGDGWISYLNECLEQVDPKGKKSLSDAKKMYEEKK